MFKRIITISLLLAVNVICFGGCSMTAPETSGVTLTNATATTTVNIQTQLDLMETETLYGYNISIIYASRGISNDESRLEMSALVDKAVQFIIAVSKNDKCKQESLTTDNIDTTDLSSSLVNRTVESIWQVNFLEFDKNSARLEALTRYIGIDRKYDIEIEFIKGENGEYRISKVGNN